jgi:hypothetical protein
MKRSKTHIGESFTSILVRNDVSYFRIDRHTLSRRPRSTTEQCNHLRSGLVSDEITQVASCPSGITRKTSNPIDIPRRGNASWSIQDEVAELKVEQTKYNQATWRMYHLINAARQKSRYTNDIEKEMPSFPNLPGQSRSPAIVEEEQEVFKLDI